MTRATTMRWGGIGLALILVLMWGWARSPVSQTPPSAAETIHSNQTPATETPDVGSPSPRRLQWHTPEPSEVGPATDSQAMDDLTYAQAQPWLEARAAAGDPRAALALHQRLMECAMRRSMARWEVPTDRRTGPAADLTPAQRAENAWWQQTACHLRVRCVGSTPAAERRLLPWLVMAARAGDPEARTQFALGQWIYAGALEDLEYVPLYQAEAVRWLEQGAAAGHAQAFEALISLHSKFHSVLADSGFLRLPALDITQDPVRAAMYLWAAARLEGVADSEVQFLLQQMREQGALELSSAEQEAAQQWAQEWLAQHPGLRLRNVADPIPNPPPERVQRTTPQCVAGAHALARPEEDADAP